MDLKERKRCKIVREGNRRDKKRREGKDTRKKCNSRVVVEFRRVPQVAVALKGPLHSLTYLLTYSMVQSPS